MKTNFLNSVTIAIAALVALAAGNLHAQQTGSTADESPNSASQTAPTLSMQLRQILKDFEDDDVVDDLDRNKLLDEIAKINAKLAKQFPAPKPTVSPASSATPIPSAFRPPSPAPAVPDSKNRVENKKETDSRQSPTNQVVPVLPATKASNPSEINDDSPAPKKEAEEPPTPNSNIVVERLAQIQVELQLINRKLDWLHKRSKDSIATKKDPMTAQVK